MLLNSCSEEGKLSVLCDQFSGLSSEEKAGVLFTTSEDVRQSPCPGCQILSVYLLKVADVCTTIADFGGRNFKKALISKLIADEDDNFLGEIQERRKLSRRGEPGAGGGWLNVPDDHRHLSSADETYNSAEESLTDDAYQYEYFEFDNK